jgi:GNAT superfamily N-acetyltransferase
VTYPIRRATPHDLPRIEEVMRASMAGLGAHFYDETQTASAVEHIAVVDRQLVDDRTYFVVEDEGVVVACGGWSGRKKLFTGTGDSAQEFLDPSTDAARIRAMFVLPSHARKGIGRLILETAENDARGKGFTRFELMATLPGVPLYERCGYARVEDVTLHLPGGTTVGAVRMVK